MFANWLKILRALPGAVALMLIIGGGSFVGSETGAGGGGDAEWGVRKSAKPAIVSVTRVTAACPLAMAGKTAGGRVLAAVPMEMIFARIEKIRSGAASHGVRREPEREPSGRARSGVVRLLI